MVYRAHSELRTVISDEKTLKDQIEAAVFAARESLDPNFFLKLVKSMLQRVKAVLNAREGYTKC